jgi:hypothetical protein
MKFMMKPILFLMVVFLLGCQSEVDKCVNSSVAAWKIEEDRKKQQISLYEVKNNEVARTAIDSQEFTLAEALGKVPSLDKRTKVEVEAQMRLMCLKIANGK